MPSPFQQQTFVNPDDVKLLQEYLDARCLEPSDFPEGLIPFASAALLTGRGFRAALAANRPYIMLRYLNPKGKPYFREGEQDPYELARFLGPPKLWEGKNPPPKVIAPDGRANVLHFEPIRPLEEDGTPRDWFNLPDGQIVLHVESMVKARAVHKWTNIPCVGLNGVWSFTSSKKGVELLHANYEVDFSRFCNIILFDSNTWKPEVAEARETLAFRLRNLVGAKDVRFAHLPKGSDGLDIGPDDFLRSHGNQALLDIIKVATEYVGQEHEDLLSRMIDRAVFCTRGGTILDRVDKHVRSPAKAGDFYKDINKRLLKRGATTTVYGYNVWMDSDKKLKVLNPGYEYLGDEYITREEGTYYNGYIRSGIWPSDGARRTGRADLVISQIQNMAVENDLELLRSYIKFLKYTSAKPTSFPVLFSNKRGVGKGWFSKLAYRLIGHSNANSIDANSFISNFNRQLENKRLVIINEFTVPHSGKAAAMNSLKRFFGDEFIIIEPKGVDSYPVENRAGMIVTCNALEDVPTDGLEDRRMWYVECSNKVDVGEEDWSKLHAELDDVEVLEDFAIWVSEGENIDFSTWKPSMDEARQRAIMASSTSIEATAFTVLRDLKECEEKFVCVDYQTVSLLMTHEGIPDMDKKAAKTVTTVMKRVGWIKDERRKYGVSPGEQRWAWVLDANRMMNLSGVEVNAEMKRVAAWALGASKF